MSPMMIIDECLTELSKRPLAMFTAQEVIDILLDIRNTLSDEVFMFVLDGDELTKMRAPEKKRHHGTRRQRKVVD
jgi:hypothetical protein